MANIVPSLSFLAVTESLHDRHIAIDDEQVTAV
jgi:hypothetical protein